MILTVISIYFCFLITSFKALSDIQIAVKMVQASENSDEHPLDRQYSSLKCQLQPVDSSSYEYKVRVSVLVTVKMVTVRVYQPGLIYSFMVEPSRFICCIYYPESLLIHKDS